MNMKIPFYRIGTPIILVALLVSFVEAQLPAARLHRIFPLAGQNGTELDVTVAGADLDEASELVFSDPRITGVPKMTPGSDVSPGAPVPGQFRIKIPAEVPPGIYEVRVNGRFGLSTPRRFVVSSGTEVVGDGKNVSADSAKGLDIDQAVSSIAPANGRHFYKFTLKKDEKITLVCQAGSVDSRMNPVIVVSDLAGHELARTRSSGLRDGRIFFQAPIASQYIVSVRDSIFSGGPDYYYRLHLTRQPYLVSTQPLVLPEQGNMTLKVFGWNLPGGKPDMGVESIEIDSAEVVGPPMNTTEFPLHPSSYAVNWKTVALKQKGRMISNAIPIYVTSGTCVIEDPAKDVNILTVPADVSGFFSPGNEEDIYEFQAKAGQVFQIDAWSHRLGKDSDLILMVKQKVQDGNGNVTWKKLATVDDVGNRQAAIGPNFTTTTDDPGLRFQVPGDGTYRVSLKDQFGTYDRSIDSSYRLSILVAEPDFRVYCSPVTGRAANGNQIIASPLTLRRGGHARIDFTVERLNGFSGDVTVSLDHLLPGIECPPVTLSALQSSGSLICRAADDAPQGRTQVDVIGKSRIGDRDLTRVASLSTVVWETANKTQVPPVFRRTPKLDLSVMPFEVAAATLQVGDGNILTTSIGGKIKVPAKLVRRHGFNEAIKLIARGLPGQLKPADITIAKDKSDGAFEIFVKDKNTRPGIYHFHVYGDAKFKYSRNPEAVARAEAELKRLDALATKTNQEKTGWTNQVGADQKELASLKKGLPELQKAVAGAKQETEKSRQKIATLETAIKTAETDPAKKVDPVILEAAAANLVELKKNLENDSRVATAEKSCNAATAKINQLETRIQSLTAKTAAADAKLKSIEAAKKTIQGRIASLKKQSAPKDLFYTVISNPLVLKVVQSPISIQPVAQVSAPVGGSVNANLQIKRQFGFAEAVNLTFKAPAGLVVAPVTIAKDKSETPVAIQVPASCPPGNHKIEIVATAKFNNIDIQSTASFNINVAPSATPGEKKK